MGGVVAAVVAHQDDCGLAVTFWPYLKALQRDEQLRQLDEEHEEKLQQQQSGRKAVSRILATVLSAHAVWSYVELVFQNLKS